MVSECEGMPLTKNQRKYQVKTNSQIVYRNIIQITLSQNNFCFNGPYFHKRYSNHVLNMNLK